MKTEGPLLPGRGDVARVTNDDATSWTAATLATRDHRVIKGWAAARQAQPATGEASSSGPPGDLHVVDGGAGLRFNFPGVAAFRPIDWDEWLTHFDDHELLFVFDNDDAGRPGAGTTASGSLAGPAGTRSNRYRLVKGPEWDGVLA